MVSTRKKKMQQKKRLSQLNETLNDLVIGNDTNVSAMRNVTFEPRTNGPDNNFERIVDGEISASQKKVIVGDKFTKAFDNAVLTVENRMNDGILTAMDNVVNPRVEMAVRSITVSSGQGTSSMIQNPDR